ncbi:hypothetical protein BpHYR1_020288 [Brachionus plicatilis]|uniref:Uncharacterized protein n=1 Tax=Brachionus plicatilis TaxID=10195 RepID=A0A3M7PAF8_BRAPC|nr:hypothetical protein BpHYR1_020288 [Brachionus plicatilis]
MITFLVIKVDQKSYIMPKSRQGLGFTTAEYIKNFVTYNLENKTKFFGKLNSFDYIFHFYFFSFFDYRISRISFHSY